MNIGMVGLSNIGNTCYMSSALQCLMHTDIIQDVFLFTDVEKEINQSNPLGTEGKLLIEFVSLIREYYKTQKNSLNPGKFKKTLCKYLTNFEGYSQHDSQEFLSLFLGSVHEDLNRILSKP